MRENAPHDLTHDYNTEEPVELGDSSRPAGGFLEESDTNASAVTLTFLVSANRWRAPAENNLLRSSGGA